MMRLSKFKPLKRQPQRTRRKNKTQTFVHLMSLVVADFHGGCSASLGDLSGYRLF
jgi:hypothetical protein